MITTCRLVNFVALLVLVLVPGVHAAPQQEANQELVTAAQKGNLTQVNYWLAQGADVNAQALNGNTALLVALIEGKADCALALIRHNAQVNVRDMRRREAHLSALSMALAACTSAPHKLYKNLIVTLLDKGADVNTKDDYGTPLLHAAQAACETQASDVFRLLLARGADITVRTNYGHTVLMQVLGFSGTKPDTEMDMVQALIEKGANLLEKDPHGDTALALAACGRAPEIVKLLLDHGDDVNGVDEYGLTPLLWACSRQASTSVIKALLERGADAKVKDKEGQSALAMASERGRPEVIRLLLDRGAEVDVRGKYQETPLMQAANHLNLATVRLLVKRGAGVNAVDDVGYSPLMWAVIEFELAEDGGATDYWPKSRYDLLPLLKYLVQRGADMNVRNKEGQTVLSLAKRTNPRAAVWLQQHGATE